MLNRLTALMLLGECTGDDIWSIPHCQQRRVPAAWIEALADCFESGFVRDDQTIYVDHTVVNQYQGIRDIDLAIRLADYLGIDVEPLQACTASRAALVRAIQEAAEEA